MRIPWNVIRRRMAKGLIGSKLTPPGCLRISVDASSNTASIWTGLSWNAASCSGAGKHLVVHAQPEPPARDVLLDLVSVLAREPAGTEQPGLMALGGVDVDEQG